MNDDTLRDLWLASGGDAPALDAVTLTGAEPALPSSFAVGTAARAAIAAAALAAREIGRERSGLAQDVTVDMRHAAIEFRSERYLRVDGRPGPEPWDRIAGLYRTGDGGHVRLHTNFAHHRDGVLALLGCGYEREAVARALCGWNAFEFEQAASERGLCVAALRDFATWDTHPQGQALAREPLIRFTRLDDSPPRPLPPVAATQRPLEGLRVLDLTRVIAGPVATRTLAAHGAEVLLLTAAHLPAIDTLVIDTGRGKRSARLDLRSPGDAATLHALVRGADVFVQGYRPGALAALGFEAARLARERPGIVVASLDAYGIQGPWAGRRGFDSLVQTASGFNLAEAEAAGDTSRPRVLPAQACDHASGYLLALGVMQALRRGASEGGSWQVQVSLARTGLWLRSLPRLGAAGLAASDPAFDAVRDLLEPGDSPFGRLTAVRHAGRLSHTAPRWSRPPVPLGTHPACWESSAGNP